MAKRGSTPAAAATKIMARSAYDSDNVNDGEDITARLNARPCAMGVASNTPVWIAD